VRAGDDAAAAPPPRPHRAPGVIKVSLRTQCTLKGVSSSLNSNRVFIYLVFIDIIVLVPNSVQVTW